MKQYSIISLCFLLLFLGGFLKSQAAISTNITADTTLIIENISYSNAKIRKRQIFEKGQQIKYRKKGEKERYTGKLHGFEADKIIIIENRDGTFQKVEVSTLDYISRRKNFRTLLCYGLLGIGTLFLVSIALLLAFLLYIILVAGSVPYGIGLSFLPFIIGIVSTVVGYLGLRKFKKFRLRKKWKAKISTIEIE